MDYDASQPPVSTASLDFTWLPTPRTCGCPDGRLNCLSRQETYELGSTVINVSYRVRWQEKHGGRFIPQVPEKFIRLFSHAGETVLDPFCGSGTTNVVAKGLGRSSVGIDVNPRSAQMTRGRLARVADSGTRHEIVCGSCMSILPTMPADSIDLVVTSPPYFDIVDYEDSGTEQWGNIADYAQFIACMDRALRALQRVVKPGGFIVLVTQDVFKGKAKCPIHADYILIGREIGLEVVSTQVYILNYSNGGRLVFGYPRSYYPKNDHEFIVVLRKPAG
ncbi:MAG: site-specific DNA-methyltransferase [Bacteroidetes bacterium]|nr:site-specific DNA-methyltransferase [Bacteroidota bacterium]MCL5025556.1 site-specific DNA-methyltransferase [Chloroflexota bacterium]